MTNSKTVDTRTIYSQLLVAKHCTAYALEKAAKLGNKTISSAMRRNTAISYETAIRINQVYPDVNIEWLRTGEGDMIFPIRDQLRQKRVDFVRQVPFEDFMEAPVLIRDARAGYMAAHGDQIYLESLPTMLVPREFDKGSYLVIVAHGDSMDDGSHRAIFDGDKLLVKEVTDNCWNSSLPIRRNLYVISTRQEAPVVKQITEINESSKVITCHSWNNQFEDYPVLFDDIDRLFEVKKIVERQIRL